MTPPAIRSEGYIYETCRSIAFTFSQFITFYMYICYYMSTHPELRTPSAPPGPPQSNNLLIVSVSKLKRMIRASNFFIHVLLTISLQDRGSRRWRGTSEGQESVESQWNGLLSAVEWRDLMTMVMIYPRSFSLRNLTAKRPPQRSIWFIGYECIVWAHQFLSDVWNTL